MLFAGAALVTGIAIMALVPWGKGLARTDENYYTVILNGNEIGNVSDVAIAENAYAQARIRLEEEWKDGVYVDGTLSLVENHAWRGAATEQNILEDKIYQELSKSVVDVQQTVYTLSVGDVSVVLSSLEEVAEVVDSVKDIYEAGDDYQTVITESDSERFGTATCELVQASIEPENRPMVMASGDGTVDESGNAETDVVSFGNDIEIVETYAEETVSVEEAVSMIKDALQVVSVKEETYTEEIAYSVEYVYDYNRNLKIKLDDYIRLTKFKELQRIDGKQLYDSCKKLWSISDDFNVLLTFIFANELKYDLNKNSHIIKDIIKEDTKSLKFICY